MQSPTKFSELNAVPNLISAEVAARKVGVNPHRLLELCSAGYAPHYRVDGGEPRFRFTELAAWVKRNLIQVSEGLPMPRHALAWAEADNLSVAEAPLCLRGIERLQACPLPPIVSGIYFLCWADAVVYVGQSRDVFARIINHRSSKRFDGAFYLPVPISELDKMEGAFIRLLTPCLNGNPGPNTDAKTIDRLRGAVGVASD